MDGHEYRVGAPRLSRGTRTAADADQDTFVFPLRDTVFEGAPAKIPYKFRDVLESEYGKKALANTEFNECVPDTPPH